MRGSFIAAMALAALAVPQVAGAWGIEGHETIALIAESYLSPAEHAEVQRLLSLPIELNPPATMKDRATWADAYRQSSDAARKLTHLWHFVDLEIDSPDMTAACFGDHPLPAGTDPGWNAPNECVVQKIEEFRRVLADKSQPDKARARALSFLLHLVGDVHQPLHAAERHDDQGGNLVYVVAGSARYGTNLHSFWDRDTVKRLGSTPEALSGTLIADISGADRAAWQQGTSRDWAMESYQIAHDNAYRTPAQHRSCVIKEFNKPAHTESCIVLDDTYRVAAAGKVHQRLEMAGVRLAWVISQALD